MRSKVVRTLALALLLAGVGIVLGQAPRSPQELFKGQEKAKLSPKRKIIRVEEDETPKPKGGGKKRVEEEEETPKAAKQKGQPAKSRLEEMLAEALKNNPDIRVAAAKLAEADAELNRTRVQVTQKVAMLYHAIEAQKRVVELAETKYKRYQGLLQGRSINETLADEKQQELAVAKAKLAELQAQVPALLGKSQSSTPAEEARTAVFQYSWTREASGGSDGQAATEGKLYRFQLTPNIPQAEKLRKALQTPVKVNYDLTLDDILSDLAKKVPGLSFRNLVRDNFTQKIHLRFEEALPVSAILQALADETRCLFYVREYGILATHVVCPGAITVEEFLRQKPAQTATPAGAASNDGMPWKPPENMEGTINQIGSLGGFLSIDFKTVDGLLTGHTLHVYRPSQGESKPKYLGMVRIVSVSSKPDASGQSALAQPVGRFKEPPKMGDKVTSHSPEK